MEPIFLTPVYKEIIWGGTNFKRLYNRDIPSEKTAESWEICAHKNGTSEVQNGQFKGMLLDELFNSELKEKVFGKKCSNLNKFPVLNKFIDANDKLSIQVHPDDEYAKNVENDVGKTEMWYIVDAKENAQIIYGLKEGTTKEDFKTSILNGKPEDMLNYVPVNKGDVIFIPAGTIHAILDGIIIYEIQQNSDITYRVFDWNRLDKDGNSRELHVEKAIDVTNFNFKANVKKSNTTGEQDIVNNEYFNMSKICVDGEYVSISNEDTFYAITVVDGSGKLVSNGNEYELISGTSFIIPALLGEFSIKSDKMEIIKTYL